MNNENSTFTNVAGDHIGDARKDIAQARRIVDDAILKSNKALAATFEGILIIIDPNMTGRKYAICMSQELFDEIQATKTEIKT